MADLRDRITPREPLLPDAEPRGQWVVVLRLIPANEDELLGPFHSAVKAEAVAERLNRDIESHAATRVMEAFVQWVRPASTELEDARDKMLADLDEMGYPFLSRNY